MLDNQNTYWITPANPTVFDVEGAFNAMQEIDWRLNASPEVGDIVYIYISGDNNHLAFKTKVVKTDIPYSKTINDKKFNLVDVPDGDEEVYTRLHLLKTIDGKNLNLATLKSHGLNSSLQSTQGLPEPCRDFIEGCLLYGSLNQEKYKEVVADYIANFSEWWKTEVYKLTAIKTFQAKWNIDAPNFKKMFLEATSDHVNLLDAGMFWPRAMVCHFADADMERTREMFRNLYDETKPLIEREKLFIEESNKLNQLLTKPGKNTYQSSNSISTYLWMRYPDRYYIYKYEVMRAASNYLGYSRNSTENIENGMAYFECLRHYLLNTPEVMAMYEAQLKNDGAEDHAFHTLAIDFDFFLGKNYLSRNKQYWLYTPGDNANNWETDYAAGIMAIGWNEIGDLSQYTSKTAIGEAMKKQGWKTKSAKTLYDFANNVREGDVVFAREGVGKIIGMGIVEGPYMRDDTQGEFKNFHQVRWTHRADIEVAPFLADGRAQLARDTFVDITNEDYPRKIENMLLNKIPLNIEKYISLLTKYKNIILHGAPGTGKTTIAKAIANQMQAEEGFVQFHPSYDYTDFVEGLRPYKNPGSQEIGFRHKNGIFKEFCKKALENPDTNYVFIIDEINRGDISKIFGELFFAIDPGYPGEKGKVNTQYQNIIEDGEGWEDGFFVPNNVYIIGTMNDIDRSVESLDFAMHRRFQFLEVTAEESAENMRIDKDDKVVMKRLNDAIASTPNLGVDFQIGASYFKDKMDLSQRWELSLKRLLKEYLRGVDRTGEKFKTLETAYFGKVDDSDE